MRQGRIESVVPAAEQAAGGMRVLFIGKRFYTSKDTLIERFGRIYQLPSQWALAGADVRLWLVDYHSREIQETSDGPLQILSAPVLGGRSIRELLRLLLYSRPQIVVASGDCYLGLLGWLLACLCGACFVFDIYDKYDEFSAYVRPFGLDLFGFLRRKADVRLYAAQSLARHFGDLTDNASNVVPNGIDERKFRPMEQGDCRGQLGLQLDQRLIGYFGSLEPDRGINELVAAVGNIRKKNPKVYLLICGVPHAGTELDRDWIIYRGAVLHERIPLYINACDVLAMPYRRSLQVDTSSSCKIAEYFACQRPIVSTRSPNLIENFPEQAAELGDALCTPGDVEDLARAITYQLDHGRILPPIRDMEWTNIARRAYDLICQTAHSQD